MSLICGAFMMVFSLFSLVGCGLVKTDTTKANKETVMIINGVKLSKADIFSSFYTYYQNNSSYFSYYDNKTIEDSFYTWTIIREVIDQKAKDALENGEIFYTKKDEETVWKNVKEYFYSQVSTKEKAIYELAKYEADKYPVWIRAEEDETAASGFEAYESLKPDPIDENRSDPSNLATKWTDEFVLSKLPELKTYLFEYVVVEADEEKGVQEERDDIDETGYIVGARNDAYAKYLEGLDSTAKANGKKMTKQELLEKELVRVYEAYYESQITTIFQKYYLEEKLLESELMSQKEIVRAYLEQYLMDQQKYISESAYNKAMEITDNSSKRDLVLYHYNDSTGKTYYFTVQHILVKYDDNMSNKVSQMEGYPSNGKDLMEQFNDAFVAERNSFTEARHEAMLVAVKENYNLESVSIQGSYYFYDETKKDDAASNYGYIKVLETTVEKGGEQVKLYYVDSNDNELYDPSIDTQTYNEDQVKLMATYDQILATYNGAYDVWSTIAADYFDLTVAGDKADFRADYPNMGYLFDTVDQMKEAYASEPNKDVVLRKINEKLASYLFIELQWIYSADGLANEFSNKSGLVIPNFPDEQGGFVSEFAIGSRELFADMEDGYITYMDGAVEKTISLDEIFATGDVAKLTKCVNSVYGYHMIKVSDVYQTGSSLVDMTGMLDNVVLDDSPEGQAYVAEMIKRMKETYVSNGSNQTVYQYFCDKLYAGYAGSSAESSSAGTYFLDIEYDWLVELYDENKISYKNKLSYEDLMDYIS